VRVFSAKFLPLHHTDSEGLFSILFVFHEMVSTFAVFFSVKCSVQL